MPFADHRVPHIVQEDHATDRLEVPVQTFDDLRLRLGVGLTSLRPAEAQDLLEMEPEASFEAARTIARLKADDDELSYALKALSVDRGAPCKSLRRSPDSPRDRSPWPSVCRPDQRLHRNARREAGRWCWRSRRPGRCLRPPARYWYQRGPMNPARGRTACRWPSPYRPGLARDQAAR